MGGSTTTWRFPPPFFFFSKFQKRSVNGNPRANFEHVVGKGIILEPLRKLNPQQNLANALLLNVPQKTKE